MKKTKLVNIFALLIAILVISNKGYSQNCAGGQAVAPNVHSGTSYNDCPATTVNLSLKIIGVPLSEVRWFTNNTHTGAQLTGGQVAAAGAGTYYAFYYYPGSNCYSAPSLPVTVVITSCTSTICSSSISPPAVVNGISITGSGTGSVSTFFGAYSSCTGTVTTPTASLYLGNFGAFTYTYTFSVPVNDLLLAITATGQASGETFTFVTNGGGTPTISTTLSCYTTISGNTITSGMGGSSTGGGGVFAISNPGGSFTTLTVTGPGGNNGSLFSLCVNSPGINCLAGSTAPPLSSNSISNICPATTVNLNALHTGVAPAGTTLVWFTNSTHTGAQYATPTTAGAGTYFAFYFDAVNNCYSPASSVLVTINTCGGCNAGATAPVLSSNNVTNTCPQTTFDLNSLLVGAPPAGTTLVWFTNNTHTGAQYSTPTTAGAGTYYAFFFDAVNNCYSPASSPVTVTNTVCGGVPDLTPSVDIDDLSFTAGQTRDFVVNLFELLNTSTVVGGQAVTIRINRISGWDITVPGLVLNGVGQSGSNGNSNVFGGTANENGRWLFSQNAGFITITLKPGEFISGGGSAILGFTATRKPGTITGTSQNITATIVAGSGGETDPTNNVVVTTISAN